jgi:hypothetical protein
VTHETDPVRHDTDTVHHETVVERDNVTYRSSPGRMIERVVIYIFGLVQGLLLLRIVLLLLAAREGNAIVGLVYDISDVLVAPFRGIFAMNQISSGETALDVAAIVALIGWTILELLVLGLVRIVRPTTTA